MLKAWMFNRERRATAARQPVDVLAAPPQWPRLQMLSNYDHCRSQLFLCRVRLLCPRVACVCRAAARPLCAAFLQGFASFVFAFGGLRPCCFGRGGLPAAPPRLLLSVWLVGFCVFLAPALSPSPFLLFFRVVAVRDGRKLS